MGLNNLTTYAGGNTISDDTVNQYKTAFINDIIPRSSAGIPTDINGSLGTSSYEWLKAFIASGYWNAGDIKPHHSYNNLVGPGQGWFLCNGFVINETNYELQPWASAGDWSKYVISSPLDGKYAPNFTDKYPVGKATTSQTGGVAITSVGNSGNSVNIAHTHSVDNHVHRWYTWGTNSTTADTSFDSSGSVETITVNNKTAAVPHMLASISTSDNAPTLDLYTSLSGAQTSSSTDPNPSIQPESIEVQYYIRII